MAFTRWRQRPWHLLGVSCLAVHAAGCTGVIHGESDEGDPSQAPEVPQPGEEEPMVGPRAESCEPVGQREVGRTPLRRLTRGQYAHTVNDLLGITATVANLIPPDSRVGPFPANGASPVSDAHVRSFQRIAEQIAEDAVAHDLAQPFEACGEDRGCARGLVQALGSRAYRRPLAEVELLGLLELYHRGRVASGASGGYRMVLEALLQSPSFLYHFEVAVPNQTDGPMVKLSSYEIASRLSYFLWQSMPDHTLFEAAADDRLQSAPELRKQAERMLADPKARRSMHAFASSWLNIGRVRQLQRNPEVYPDFVPELGPAMERETQRFVDYVIREGDGLLESLISAPYSFPEGPLWRVYGVDEPPGYSGTTPVNLPHRVGVLTQPAVMAANSSAEASHPIKRGVMILNNLLCVELSLPDNFDVPELPEPTPGQSTRERFEAHTTEPACASCHKVIDPIGFAFERYDPIGAYREDENGIPIDDTGWIDIEDDEIAGPVSGPSDVADRVASSQLGMACITEQWIRYALGRDRVAADQCGFDTLVDGFRENGSVRELVLNIVSQDFFRFRPGVVQ